MRSEASFTSALNALFDAPGLVRKRPGFERGTFALGAPVHQLHTSPVLGPLFLSHEGVGSPPTGMRVGSGFGPSFGLPSVDGGAITRPGTLKQRMAPGNRNHYLTSDEGLRRLELVSSPVRFAGMPRGLSPSQESGVYNVLVATAPTWLPHNDSVAYRATWHRVDGGGVELGGAPTGRAVVRNIAGTTGHVGGAARSVSIRVPVPRELGTLSTALTASYFYRLWRSRSSLTNPDDEMFLVAEAFLTSTDITNGYAVVNDLTPNEILIGNARLHTNPTNYGPGEANLVNGIANADDPPPACNDVAAWRDCLWAADTQYRPAYTTTLVSVGGTGLVAGDTVSLDGINFLTAVAGAPGANQFSVVTTLSTLALNIEATARNIVDRHNSLYACLGTSPVFAYYTSVGAASPGSIYVEAKQQLGGASPSTSRPTAWRGTLAVAGSSASQSGATNQLAYSKAARPDAFAPVNVLTVGPRQATILRVVPYRDRMLVFTDLGLYQVTGSTWGDFAVEPFDLTFRLTGRGLVAVCDDKVYAWCIEGIVEIDESGVRVISSPIEPTWTRLVAAAGTSLASYGFAVAYRFQHRVLFMYPAIGVLGVGGCSTGLVYDTRTQAWSTLEFGVGDLLDEDLRSCAAVRFSDDRLAFGWWNPGGGDGQVLVERRTLTSADYQDTNAVGITTNVNMTLQLQFQIPDVEGALHWRQTVIHLDGSDGFAWRSVASNFSLRYFSEWGTDVWLVTPTAALVRVEPPLSTRRANRLSMQLSNGNLESCGIVGIVQGVYAGSRFARRT